MATSRARARSVETKGREVAEATGEAAVWKKWVLRLYEVPFIAAVVAFAYWARMRGSEGLTLGEHVYYIGTDPYYHYRATATTLANFPFPLRWDPFTHFPQGTGAGQFGSLFNVGAVVWIHIRDAASNPLAFGQALAEYPAVLGALLFIPFYFLARTLVGRVGAVFATVTLALIPGEFLVRSLAGYVDHHVAEALGMVLAVLGVCATMEIAYRHRKSLTWPVNWGTIGKPVGVAAVAAVGIVAYFLFWPPAIFIVGVLGIALTLMVFVEHVRGADTRYLAFTSLPFLFAGVLLLTTMETPRLNVNTFSPMQPLACFAVGAWLVGLHAASTMLRERKVHPAVLPSATVAGVIVGFLALSFLAPSLHGQIMWGLSWVTGIGRQETIGTIAETRAMEPEDFRREYGPLLVPVFLIAQAGILVSFLARRRRADLVLLVWGLFMFQAARTQVRFNYYFALVVALAVGWIAFTVAELTGLNRGLARFFGRLTEAPTAPARTGRKGKGARKQGDRKASAGVDAPLKVQQFAAVAAVGLILLPGLVIPETGPDGSRSWTSCTPGAENQLAWVLGSCFGGPGQSTVLWVDALHWMKENTPDAGYDPEARYERPPRGEEYTYPENAYGVLSWWDYGHWIQVEAERPPVANPFQNAAPFASCYFTDTDPTRAEGLLREWSERTFDRDGEDCPDVPASEPADAPLEHPTRYVMIDDEMAAGKYGAITVWAGVRDEYLERHDKTFRTPDGRSVSLAYNGPWYESTMLSRLYHDDADGLENYRLVHESEAVSLIGWVVRITAEEARITRSNALINRYVPGQTPPFEAGFETGDALVQIGSSNEYVYDARMTSAVKTFEHVAGARVTGTVDPGENVTVAVPLESATTDRSFTWTTTVTAGADGAFTAIVPYATRDYVSVEDGGTNLAVTATGPAFVYTGSTSAPGRTAEVHVPDRAVLDGDEVRVTFD